MRRYFKPTPLAVSLRAMSLLVVADGVFGILITDIIRHRAAVARVEAPSKVELPARPHVSDAKGR